MSEHYQHYSMEVIDIIRMVTANQDFDATEGYYIGNILKYILRYKYKGGADDLCKAQDYLRWLYKYERK